MEINITALITDDIELSNYSGSQWEHGDNAAKFTWNTSCKATDHHFLKTTNELNAARAYFSEFGAWSKDELAEMMDIEINALLLQDIAGHLREYLSAKESDNFEQWNENNGGHIYECDIAGHKEFGQLFFYMGN